MQRVDGDEASGSVGGAACQQLGERFDSVDIGRKLRAGQEQLVACLKNITELNAMRQASTSEDAYAVAVVGQTNRQPSRVFLQGKFPNAGVHPPRAASSRSFIERLQAGSPHLPAFEVAAAYNCDLAAGRPVTPAAAAAPEGATGPRSFGGMWAYLPSNSAAGGAAAMPPEDAANAVLRGQVNRLAKELAAKEVQLATQAAHINALCGRGSARADGMALLTPPPPEERDGGFTFRGSSSMPQEEGGGGV